MRNCVWSDDPARRDPARDIHTVYAGLWMALGDCVGPAEGFLFYLWCGFMCSELYSKGGFCSLRIGELVAGLLRKRSTCYFHTTCRSMEADLYLLLRTSSLPLMPQTPAVCNHKYQFPNLALSYADTSPDLSSPT